jgi:hypothetical protein
LWGRSSKAKPQAHRAKSKAEADKEFSRFERATSYSFILQKMETIETLADSIAYDFKNLLKGLHH